MALDGTEWDGFRAFKIWSAVNLHITTETFDIKKYGICGVCGKYETFLNRRDIKLFNKVPFMMDKNTWVMVCAASAMYGVKFSNPYDFAVVEANYRLYLSRWHGFNQLMQDDLRTLNHMGIKADDYIGIVKALLRNNIAFETVVALNTALPIVKSIKASEAYGNGRTPLASIIKPLLIRLDKSKIFVKIRDVKGDWFKDGLVNSDKSFNDEILKN